MENAIKIIFANAIKDSSLILLRKNANILAMALTVINAMVQICLLAQVVSQEHAITEFVYAGQDLVVAIAQLRQA